MSPEEVSQLQQDVHMIGQRIADIAEAIRLQSRVAEKITDKLGDNPKGGRLYWLLTMVAGLGLFSSKSVRSRLVSGVLSLTEHPIMNEIIKMVIDMLWRRRAPSSMGHVVMALAALMCYVCLFAAAYLALEGSLGAVAAWLILGGIHLLVVLAAKFFTSRQS